MYIVDITLKSTPITLSVQRKAKEDAEALYQQVVETLRSGNGTVVELTCEHQTDKKLTVLTSEISAVQIAEKSGAGSPGRTPGFFALAE